MIRNAIIRSAHPGDADTIARIHVDSWRAVYEKILPGSYLSRLNYGRMSGSILNGLLKPEIIYLIAEEQRGTAVGYICGGSERSNNPIYRSEVLELYIVPEFQRQGFGKRLLAALANALYQRHFFSLMVWVLSNNPNRRFYEKTGGLY